MNRISNYLFIASILLTSSIGNCDAVGDSNYLVHKGSVFEGNYWNLGSDLIKYVKFDKTLYAIHVVGAHDNLHPGVGASSATMVWLTRSLESIPCSNSQTQHACSNELIVDVATVPTSSSLKSTVVIPQVKVPCTWNGKPALTIVALPTSRQNQLVIAAWYVDLSNETLIQIQNQDVDCKDHIAEEAREKDRKRHAEYFLTNELSNMDKLGIQGLHKLGKVIQEDVTHSTDDNNQAVKIERHHIQYEGMSIDASLHSGGELRNAFVVNDVVITSPNWPVKDDLRVGSTRKQVENTLGLSANKRIRGHENDWIYINGLWWFSFTFDINDKVTSIEWHRDED